MTIEQAEAWKGEALTDNEKLLVTFLSKGTIKGSERVLVCSAYGLVSPDLLDTAIPQSALDQVYGEGEVTNLTLRDFALSEAVISETEAWFSLSANYNVLPKGKSRKRYTNADDVAQWLGLTESFGVTIDNIVNTPPVGGEA